MIPRSYPYLLNQEHVPDVRMLHAFREDIGVDGLREVNAHWLDPVIEKLDPTAPALALIDATDLPAAPIPA